MVIAFLAVLIVAVVFEFTVNPLLERRLETLEDFRRRWNEIEVRGRLWQFLDSCWCSHHGPPWATHSLLFGHSFVPKKCLSMKVTPGICIHSPFLSKPCHRLDGELLAIGYVHTAVACGNRIYLAGDEGLACLVWRKKRKLRTPSDKEAGTKPYVRWRLPFRVGRIARICCDLDGRLFALVKHSGKRKFFLTAISPSGEVLWQRSVPPSYPTTTLLITPTGKVVVAGRQSSCLFGRNGDMLWACKEEHTPNLVCTLWDGEMVVFAGEGTIWARSASNGLLLWSLPFQGSADLKRICTWRDQIYGATEDSVLRIDSHGQILWQHRIPQPICDIALTIRRPLQITPHTTIDPLILVLTKTSLLSLAKSGSTLSRLQHNVTHPSRLLATPQEVLIIGEYTLTTYEIEQGRFGAQRIYKTKHTITASILLPGGNLLLCLLADSPYFVVFGERPPEAFFVPREDTSY